MKTLLFITGLIAINLSTALSSYAKQEGIYLTANDYKNRTKTYSTDSKIHLNNSILDLPYITVVNKNNKIKLKKSEVFAYSDADNKVFRFYKNTQYLIAASEPIAIYVQYEHVAQSKGYKVKQNFYFSTTLDGALIPLTLSNLKQAYSGNEQFIDLLDQYFNNEDVTAFDPAHNMYKLNYVYGKLKNK